MMNLLVLKERIIKIYQKTDIYLKPLLKFLVSFIVFFSINQNVGYDPSLKAMPITIILSFLGALAPSAVLVFLAAAVVAGHIYFVSKVMAVLVIIIFFILYFLFIRFTPKLGYVVLAVPILFMLKIPYVVPILLGLIAAPVSVIPAGCGILVYFLFNIIKETATNTLSSSMEDVLALYKYVMDSLLGNKEMRLALIVFTIVIIVTYLVRKSRMDYAFYIAIGVGVVTNIFAFLIGDLSLNISNQIGMMVFGSILSGLFVMVVQFFRLTLDYTAVERVQFEDDDYYYYVKAVPKIKITVPKKDVKRIHVQKATGNTMNLRHTLDRTGVEKEDIDSEDIDSEYIHDFMKEMEEELEDIDPFK